MKSKTPLFLLFSLLMLQLTAQDVGKVVIKNGKDSYPKFITSLNGVRISNEYVSQVTYSYLDEYQYKINILQAGSRQTLSFMVYSQPNYLSTYVINKDTYGNFLFTMESKVLMKDSSVTESSKTPTVVAAVTATTGPVMDEGEYFDIIKTLKKEPVEKNRVELAKTFFANKWLLSSMVKDAIKVFNLEPSKVAFAKFAYARTVDKQNYYKVFDGLNLTNSKKEMNEFIKANP
jgi:hypothetical protein